jgi:tRNA(fMet)-specific endonuclease VapC
MEPAILGIVLDSSILIAAERRKRTAAQVIEDVVQKVGAVPVILSALTVAEVGHGICRANTAEIRTRRRAFLDELKATIPVHSITETTAEIIARVGGEQAAKGINLPSVDLIIGACALERGYATHHPLRLLHL